jgi:hypothetical protein
MPPNPAPNPGITGNSKRPFISLKAIFADPQVSQGMRQIERALNARAPTARVTGGNTITLTATYATIPLTGSTRTFDVNPSVGVSANIINVPGNTFVKVESGVYLSLANILLQTLAAAGGVYNIILVQQNSTGGAIRNASTGDFTIPAGGTGKYVMFPSLFPASYKDILFHQVKIAQNGSSGNDTAQYVNWSMIKLGDVPSNFGV